ncbi:MAG: cupin domain-containing protein [Desulfobacterales bacterium]|uniref:Cupin domain-containing protein n=1 Tax=Candidatus Desulfatibia profunda TaxID=2841695 RepID=A0A8J6TP91_9BACT|nr:cupin domain-containing protein [Candidatus Desulfatibia profunda]MBL7179229.1 cupin domain-containing protein [Desulfobacterales bacterium]
MNNIQNIYASIPDEIPKELFQDILKTDRFKIERIVSKGHASPEGFWYDQKEHEWVILLKGRAGLLFEGNDKIIELKPGDYINIPARLKHRVQWTDPDVETVWLAVIYI